MASTRRTGRNKRHKVGYIALGYSKDDDFWYCSEGVFATKSLAIRDLKEGYRSYPIDLVYAVKVPLDFKHGERKHA